MRNEYCFQKQLGVSISHEAKLFVITGPTGPYFNSKVTLYADPSFARSFAGGVGAFKMGWQVFSFFFALKNSLLIANLLKKANNRELTEPLRSSISVRKYSKK